MPALAELEIPAAAPLDIGGETLHGFAGYRFSLTPRRGGRHPELGDLDVLEWIGRFIGRIHAVGAVGPAVRDLRMLLSGEREEMSRQLAAGPLHGLRVRWRMRRGAV
ncbi:hypothetical protein Atep_15750 [Allochromatium tepidum]|uniref:Aminoglycoside phosphotransferase domain-containing protein n=1 Tax=Allochromatium tepidum TaxID=553982 RepID=A0ABM7QMA0_9GAMM|nr:hypothetical protein Atep_15750 [Allochromatium tepidum]